jgi:hypothetical protein
MKKSSMLKEKREALIVDADVVPERGALGVFIYTDRDRDRQKTEKQSQRARACARRLESKRKGTGAEKEPREESKETGDKPAYSAGERTGSTVRHCPRAGKCPILVMKPSRENAFIL